MTKTSSSNLQNQARPSPLQVHQETSSETIMQPSTSISRDLNDQKSNTDGLQHKVDEMGSKDHVCIIDVRNEEEKEKENKNDEKVCRICQLLSTDHLPAGAGNVNLVFLGCACRGELGISHYHCALVWFQQKGNRTCEICGKPAKNVAGIEDTGFRAYGTDIGIITTEIAMSHGSYPTDHRCSTSLSRFLLVAVVLAFVLPWAIRPSRIL
ncbi:uncharacterized protein LOC110699710 [Chenopodium quinoa]|uniref:uncharacterized protein LOC110699710 n=1 Tax=Chenopodium quinoa TaxID=63459 RepID=UPI000B7817CF|nr:uncharacterized protein LOC110699710 [Chenopodium quinoa]